MEERERLQDQVTACRSRDKQFQQLKTLVSQSPFIMQCQDNCWPEHVGTDDGDDQGSCYHMFVVFFVLTSAAMIETLQHACRCVVCAEMCDAEDFGYSLRDACLYTRSFCFSYVCMHACAARRHRRLRINIFTTVIVDVV